MTGRELDEELITEIVRVIGWGAAVDTAASAVGIGPAMLAEWTARGERELDRRATGEIDETENVYVDLVTAIAKALAGAEARLLLQVRRAADESKGWQAAAWLLERRWPEKWSKQQPGEPVKPGDGPADQIAEVVAMRRKRRERPAG